MKISYLKNLFKKLLPSKHRSSDRVDFLRKVFNFVKNAEDADGGGDYLEFGVFKGSTFVETYKMANAKNLKKMRFFAFDSFEGLPEITGLDKQSDQFAKGEYSASRDVFNATLKNSGIDVKDVQIVKGWFNETLNADTKKRLGLKSVSVAWIDADLYESTVPVLDFIYDLIVDGTILVFDDWYFFKGNPNQGEQRAFREWLAKHPELSASEFHKYFWHGNSFIIHKK